MADKPTLYIGYDLPSIQKIALRLQALAKVAGIMAYVPTADTRNSRTIDDDDALRIWAADAVIIFLSAQKKIPSAVDKEIENARNAGTVLTILSVTKSESHMAAGFDSAVFSLILTALGLANLYQREK